MSAVAGSKPWEGRRIHLVGVGGAGMSGYARAAHALGANVTGSDGVRTPYLDRLQVDGVLTPSIGYAACNLPGGDDVELYCSSAVPAENPERAAARQRGLPEHPRADLLAQLSALRRTIAVAGTHGKTTTSAMIVHALLGGGLDPGWMVGGTISAELPNAHWSEGEWLVIEADESDRSMLSLTVEIAVLTNVELDHHAAYASLSELREAFAQFLAKARQGIVVWDRPELVRLTVQRPGVDPEELVSTASPSDQLPSATTPSPSTMPSAQGVEVVAYDVEQPQLHTGGSHFRWRDHEVRLSVPGAHNALNAVGALEAARLAGVEEDAAIEGLARFGGAGRRFQRLGDAPSGALVVDDYAHHPTEVQATIAAARSEMADGVGRLVAVFQPHLYSRTALLANEFGRALSQADVIAVLDVYAARECAEDHPGVSGLAIARAASEHGKGRQVMWLPTIEQAEAVLRGTLRRGDLCLVMGAGDVDALARRLVMVGEMGRDGGENDGPVRRLVDAGEFGAPARGQADT